jgi:hypothetical protein
LHPLAFQSVTAILPKHAHALYYRDEIGNVSTSAIRFKRDKVEAIITPRFPLMGGWKTNFIFGYSLPTAPYLKHTSSGKLRLEMLFACPIDEAVVDELTVKVAPRYFLTVNQLCSSRLPVGVLDDPASLTSPRGWNAMVQVVLPEGASGIESDIPFEVASSSDTK